MAGTLTAAVGTTQHFSAVLSGGSELTATATELQTVAVGFSSEGHLDVASVKIQAAAAGNLAGIGVLVVVTKPLYVKTFTPNGAGTLSATAVDNFEPFDVTTNKTNVSVPSGSIGCYVTLVGSGGNGGNGYSSSSSVYKGGGGGGGAGGKVNRSFISRGQMGSTYTCSKSTGPSVFSKFSSGGKQVSANNATNGSGGGNNSSGAGGAGGTVTVTGFTGISTATGGKGGDGGDSGDTNGTGGNSPGGGGGGGVGPSLSGTNAGSAGNGNGGDGGTGRAFDTGFPGQDGGHPGGGGGGGGGGDGGGAGGAGAAGSMLIEWV